jgi:serine/threonine protein kinase
MRRDMSMQYGDWRIIKTIGSGAFGTVYEIRRETLGFVQSAALKVISIPQS